MIDEIQRLLAADLAEGDETGTHLHEATDRALALAAAGAPQLGAVALIADVLPELWLRGELEVDGLRSIVDSAAAVVEEPSDQFRLRLADRFYGGPALLHLAPELAVEMALGLLPVISLVRQASLWELDSAGRAVCSAYSGNYPTKRARELARGALLGGGVAGGAGLLLAAPVTRWGRPVGVIVTRPERGRRALSVAVLREVAPAIGAVLERGSLLDRRANAERSVTEASERRLTRLAFDLHDGPLQNVAGIGGDLAMLRRRLQSQLDDPRLRADLLSSIDDLEARLLAIDSELRDISHSLESPAVPRRPFAEVLEGEVEAFRRHSDIRPCLELEGSFEGLTPSQRIATWRIVQESLTNVRDHSAASEVRVKAAARGDRLEVEIVDDGRGFEVSKTLLDSARRGRLGLVGVSERVRLLGGRCEIRSAPGGPTTISVVLPRWRPPVAESAPEPALANLAST